MKANEAPEKLYISNFDIEALPKYEQLSERWHEISTQDTDIEYTRTDVFIEKALKWYCRDCECNDNCTANCKCAFRDFFEMYLKGNEKALPPKIGSAINPDGSTTENYRYRHFIERMQDAFIEKACEWLKANARYYMWRSELDVDCGLCDEFFNDFKKAMEE